ncbi:hypothetical protein TNCV_1048981 [Trichonephila clavipes]|nr:hypothetical protein TNCV_1048981 [Trichonephila clavipes]
MLRSPYLGTRGLLAKDLVIWNHGQVTRVPPELAPDSPNYHTILMGGRLSSRQIQRASPLYTAAVENVKPIQQI